MKRKKPAPDRRVQRTQKALREALLQLLKTYPLQKIAVTKLCELSDLNRTTFYTYYSDPTDLFNSIVDDVIERLEIGIRDSFSSNSFDSLMQLCDSITRNIFENRELYCILFSARSDINFMQRVSSLSQRNPFSNFQEQNPDYSSETLEYLLLFLLNGCNGILQQWIVGNFREPPELISQYMQLFCSSTLTGMNEIKKHLPAIESSSSPSEALDC